MHRILSLLAAFAIAATPALVAGATTVLPATFPAPLGGVTTTRATTSTSDTNLTSRPAASIMTTGNGAPNGPHYNLNLIGVPKTKTADMTGSNGHVIFVSLSGNTKIDLSVGDYQVLDANGTDGTAAFQLPNPDPDLNGVTAYSVYARALGKPNGSAVATSCVTDATLATYCSTENVVLVRSGGKSKFANVSKELLTVCLDTDGDKVCDLRTSLFADTTSKYFWDYDNNGLKLAQLRFYELPSNVGLVP